MAASAFTGTQRTDADGRPLYLAADGSLTTDADQEGAAPALGAPYTYRDAAGTAWNRDQLESTGEGLHHIVDVAAGYNFSVALDAWGNVFVWGSGAVVNGGAGSTLPVKVDFTRAYDEDYMLVDRASTPAAGDGDGVIVVDVAAGRDHAVALDSNGTLWTWGNDGFGQLGADAATYLDAQGKPVNKWDWAIDYTSAVSTYNLTSNYYPYYNRSYTRLREDLFHQLLIDQAAVLSARDSQSAPVHVVRGEAAVRGAGPLVGYKYLDHIVDIQAGDYFTLALRSDGSDENGSGDNGNKKKKFWK